MSPLARLVTVDRINLNTSVGKSSSCSFRPFILTILLWQSRGAVMLKCEHSDMRRIKVFAIRRVLLRELSQGLSLQAEG